MKMTVVVRSKTMEEAEKSCLEEEALKSYLKVVLKTNWEELSCSTVVLRRRTEGPSSSSKTVEDPDSSTVNGKWKPRWRTLAKKNWVLFQKERMVRREKVDRP